MIVRTMLVAACAVAVVLLQCAGCGDDDQVEPDAGPCWCTFALCRSDGTCWCPTDAGVTERCVAP